MPSQPSVRPLVSRALLAALATGLLALSSVGAAAAASDAEPATPEPARAASTRSGGGAAATGVVITWRSADRRFEAAEPEQAAALVQELQRLLAGGLAERLHLASGPTLAQRTAGGLVKARMPAELINLSVVRVDDDGAFAGTCSQGPAGALHTLSQAPAPARPEKE